MSFMEWSQQLCLGFRVIDEHHRLLLDYINLLHDHVESEAPRDLVERVLDCLVNYTIRHFGYEEFLFERYDYPEREEHAREHARFSQTIYRFQARFKVGESNVSMELLESLKQWLFKHIMVSDKEYQGFMARAFSGIKRFERRGFAPASEQKRQAK